MSGIRYGRFGGAWTLTAVPRWRCNTRRIPQKRAAIADLILERPLCLSCIGVQVDSSEAAAEGYLAVIERSFCLRRAEGRCAACGVPGETVALGRVARRTTPT